MLRATLALITFLALMTFATAAPFDAFLVAGQSNADGRGSSEASPEVSSAVGLQFFQNSLGVAQDPVGGAATGSAWPAFINAYHSVTGRSVLIISAAAGGSPLVVNQPYSWHPNGMLWSASVYAVRAAEAALTGQNHEMTFRGILWSQGEYEGQLISQGSLTQAAYQSALQGLISRYRAALGPEVPFYIIRTGYRVRQTFDAGYHAIHVAQEAVADADPYTWVVYRETVWFRQRGWMRDDVHYTQEGYNDIGTKAGAYVGCLVSGLPYCSP